MITKNQEKAQWDWVIGARAGWWSGFNTRELWSYRNLLTRWIRRDLILHYQQTLLGPVWIILQPIFTLITYVLVFGKLIGISTGGIPPVLFYMSGIVLWNFFSESMLSASLTFTTNASLFSKVYFPRIIVPFANLTSNLVRFLLQFLLLVLLLVYYAFTGAYDINHITAWIWFLPIVLIAVACFSLGLGIFFSVLTGKYRDLIHVVNLGIRLMMFLTPVIYPVKLIPENIKWLVALNPMAPLMEAFRFGIFGEGEFTVAQLAGSIAFIMIFLIGSVMLFNKQSDRIMDVV